LNILDHGNSTGVQIGTDWVDSSTFPTFESSFRKLQPKFSKGGFVHLQHCEIGSNTLVLTLFAVHLAFRSMLAPANTIRFIVLISVTMRSAIPPLSAKARRHVHEKLAAMTLFCNFGYGNYRYLYNLDPNCTSNFGTSVPSPFGRG
jgi:hypothetical protein